MKKTILLVVCALLGVLTASAQKLVLKVDGVEQEPIEVWRIDEMKFIPSEPVNLTDTPDTLDFGLSVRWADRNLGAASPKDPGRLIGWGDTTLTNYSTKLQYFPTETALSQISGSQYDVAAVKWDNKWHLPTAEELEELIAACTWTWVNDVENDSVGVVGTLKTDETKTIFLPATGYRSGENDPIELVKGYYWTGSLGQEAQKAKLLNFGEGTLPSVLSEDFRYLGLAMRPVTGPVVMPTGMGTVVVTSKDAMRATVTATLTGDLQDSPEVVVCYATSESSLSKANGRKLQSSEIGQTITINLTGLVQNTTYYVKVYLTTTNGDYESSVVSFTTDKLNTFPVADAVDLGLPSGLKWASWNMGSSSPMDVPDTKYARYGWGDPTGEAHSLNTSDYAISSYGKFQSGNVVDIAGTAYDIATTQWGDGWRLPREADLRELMQQCTFVKGTYTDENNKTYYGMKVTGPNGNYILLPSAGFKNSRGSLIGDKGLCTYWMSTNNNSSSIPVPVLFDTYIDFTTYSGYVYYQVPIRPVYDDGNGSTTPTDPTPTDPTPTDPTPTDPTPTDPTPSDPTPSAGNYVDLGLSVLWADRNVGSSSATAVGSYFRWGETSVPSPEVYSMETYSLYQNGAYVTQGLSTLPAANDAAAAQWGGTWRMPAADEWAELVSGCDWVVENNGFRIYKKGSTKKSESIFLPVSGYKTMDKGVVTIYNDDYCKYWSSTLNSNVNYEGSEAHAFSATPNSTTKSPWSSARRYRGMPIRPVMPKN